MSVTLGSFLYPNAAGYSGAVSLRLWYSGCHGNQFIDSANEPIPCGDATNFYLDIPCTLVDDVITVPTTELPTTDDSQTASVLATAQFFVDGAACDFLFTGWIITATLGASVTFPQLWIYNLQVTPAFTLSASYLTAPQVAALIATAVGVLANVTLNGVQTLTNKTLTQPIIADFTAAQHGHEDAAGGNKLGTDSLNNNSVTYAKMQNVAANKLLGSVAGGSPEEIACTAAGRAILDDANAAAQLTTLGLTATAAELNKLDGAGTIVASGTQHAHIADVGNTATGTQLATAINAILDALEAFGINAI
jgi:hypothetical protein